MLINTYNVTSTWFVNNAYNILLILPIQMVVTVRVIRAIIVHPVGAAVEEVVLGREVGVYIIVQLVRADQVRPVSSYRPILSPPYRARH